MTISAILGHGSSHAALADSGADERLKSAESFASVLSRQIAAAAKSPDGAGQAAPAPAPLGIALNGAADSQGAEPQDPQLRKAFDDFVGQTLFGQLLQSMRKSVGKPAYFHGGRTEEVFQKQLDQVLAEKMADAQGGELSQALYEQQFNLSRR